VLLAPGWAQQSSKQQSITAKQAEAAAQNNSSRLLQISNIAGGRDYVEPICCTNCGEEYNKLLKNYSNF
jgi:predicted secreted protein